MRSLKELLTTVRPKAPIDRRMADQPVKLTAFSEPTKDDKLFKATNIKTFARGANRFGRSPENDGEKEDPNYRKNPAMLKVTKEEVDESLLAHAAELASSGVALAAGEYVHHKVFQAKHKVVHKAEELAKHAAKKHGSKLLHHITRAAGALVAAHQAAKAHLDATAPPDKKKKAAPEKEKEERSYFHAPGPGRNRPKYHVRKITSESKGMKTLWNLLAEAPEPEPLDEADIDHPAYHTPEKTRGYTSKVSPLSGDYHTTGRMLRKRMPGMDKEAHKAEGDKHSQASHETKREHGHHVEKALDHLRDKGTDSGPLISGIVSDKFDDGTKDTLRHLAHKSSDHASAAFAHYAASGMHLDSARLRHQENKATPAKVNENLNELSDTALTKYRDKAVSHMYSKKDPAVKRKRFDGFQKAGHKLAQRHGWPNVSDVQQKARTDSGKDKALGWSFFKKEGK